MVRFKHLGAYLKERRLGAEYSQGEISKLLEYSNSQFVSNWERGLSSPPGDDLHRLIRILRLDRETLVEVMLEDARAELIARVYPKKSRG